MTQLQMIFVFAFMGLIGAVFYELIAWTIAAVICAALGVLLIAIMVEAPPVAIFVTFIVGSFVLLFWGPRQKTAKAEPPDDLNLERMSKELASLTKDRPPLRDLGDNKQ